MPANIDDMNQVEMRVECGKRGLIIHGTTLVLRARLKEDDARGVFRGNFATMSDEYLDEGCKILCISRSGTRQDIIRRIHSYNAYKRRHENDEETEWDLNAGLPTPDDRLGKPTENTILGTIGSRLYLKSYSEYLRKYEHNHGTTEGAVTLQFWRSHRNT